MLFRKSKTPPPPLEEPPQRDIPVAIPARYVLRPNRSEFWWFLGLSLLFLLLLPAKPYFLLDKARSPFV